MNKSLMLDEHKSYLATYYLERPTLSSVYKKHDCVLPNYSKKNNYLQFKVSL